MFTEGPRAVQLADLRRSPAQRTMTPMFASRTWLATRIGHWLERWGSAMVMEAECDDGTRLLIGLDPSCHVAVTVAVTGEDRRWADGLVVPDDLSGLIT